MSFFGFYLFISCNVIGNEAYFSLECPLFNPIKDVFPSIFENVVPWSLKSFFQLDHQVDINLYLMEATTLYHYT